jgi:ABC-type enterochelin transport system permease subunit|tara:strand:+ start:4089 stop:4490 length:402 start_codon:yes stop_codon:yes gene_type:complete
MKTLEKRPESKKVTPQTRMTKKELRHYLGAAGVFILVIGLLLFLAYNDIPQSNKDIFVSIIGMIVGSLSVVIYTIIGKNPDEVNALQKKVESLQALADTMEKRNDQLEAMIIELQRSIIEKLSVVGARFELKK